MEQESITDEFVRHFHKLRDRTGNNPSRVKRALDDDPDLAVSLEKLYEILGKVERHRKYRHHLLVQDHPKFAMALSEFKSCWFRSYAYRRGWPAAVDDFIRHYQILVDQTNNRPGELLRALDKNSGLADSMEKLLEIQDLVIASSRADILFQVYAGFENAFIAFQQHWSGAPKDYLEWKISKISKEIKLSFETLSLDTDDDATDAGIGPVPPAIEEVATNYPAREQRSPFDPDRHSIAMVMEEAENYWDYDKDESSQRRAWGLAWLRTIINFQDFEDRWRELPQIIVPRHLLNDSYAGLYAYLNQIRSAYIFGADLAAVALCRATTELLIRFHYAGDVPGADDSRQTSLPYLIEIVQKRKSLQFLRKADLKKKVRQANKILHDARSGGSTFDTRHLVVEWVNELKKMITNVQPAAK